MLLLQRGILLRGWGSVLKAGAESRKLSCWCAYHHHEPVFLAVRTTLLAPARLSWSAAALFATIGLIRPFVSRQLAQAANHYLGPTISNTLGRRPAFALAFGVVVLGEA